MVDGLHDRLGYLLKHAQLALADHTGPALAPLGITGRELAVLTVLAAPDEDGPEGGAGRGASDAGGASRKGRGAVAQHEAAGRLGVDRTTMVELVDGLERKGLVERRPDPADRRRNLVHLTEAGRDALDRGRHASRAAEGDFLAALSPAEADQLRDLLRRILGVG
jgi:DNA-binding MarR family transcriptional regulator